MIIAAAHALIQLGDDRGYRRLLRRSYRTTENRSDLSEQQKAMLKDPKKMASLGIEAGVGFIPFGGLAMSGYKLLTRDDISPVLAAAALMLAKDPDPKSGQALADAAATQDKWLVQVPAAFDAIARRGDPSLLKTAETGLQDEKDQVRVSAAAAVIRLHDIQSRPKARSQAGEAQSRPQKTAIASARVITAYPVRSIA